MICLSLIAELIARFSNTIVCDSGLSPFTFLYLKKYSEHVQPKAFEAQVCHQLILLRNIGDCLRKVELELEL